MHPAILNLNYFLPFRHKIYHTVWTLHRRCRYRRRRQGTTGTIVSIWILPFRESCLNLYRHRRQGTTGTIVYRLEFTFLETSSASILHWTFRLSQLSREFSGTGFARHLDYRVFI